MKKFIFFVIIALFLCTPLIAKSQSLSIVYVDLQRVMLESDKGKDIRKTLTGEAERLKKALDGKQGELQKLKDALEKQSATITPEARADKEKQYQGKLKDYQRLVNDYQAELQQKDMEFTQNILKELGEVIKDLGDREKYALILEKNQAGILYGSSTIDITGKVITLFNEVSKKAPAPAKK
jgi:outer membrane protein